MAAFSRSSARPAARRLLGLGLLVTLAVAVASLPRVARSEDPPAAPEFDAAMLDALPSLPGGLGPLPPVVAPDDNPQTPEKIELGRMLFFDKRLSLDRTMSCASCHDPSLGFSDGRPRSLGFKGKELGRNSPSVLNTAYNGPQFWDGRAHGLEEQAKGPIMASAEMNMLSEKNLVKRLRGVKEYRRRFQEVFGGPPSLDAAAKAIAAFERTIVSGESRFDRYAQGERAALTDAEKRGAILFISKANCVACHKGPNFTDNQFHVLAGPQEGPLQDDPGRFAVTKNPADHGAFKTPTLRGIVHSGPYMHDGSFATLEEVVAFYDRGGGDAANKSHLLFRLELTPEERADLLAFLHVISGPLPDVTPPVSYSMLDSH